VDVSVTVAVAAAKFRAGVAEAIADGGAPVPPSCTRRDSRRLSGVLRGIVRLSCCRTPAPELSLCILCPLGPAYMIMVRSLYVWP
jgi:hypothetical protein